MNTERLNLALQPLARIGYQPPAAVTAALETAQRLMGVQELRRAAVADLAAAIAAADFEAARLAADRAAVAATSERASVAREAMSYAAEAVAAIWDGKDAWHFAADVYDELATKFTAAVAAHDPDAAPQMLASQKVREAYTVIPELVRKLEDAAAALTAVAALCTHDYISSNVEHQVGLVAEAPEDAYLVAAWKSDKKASRGGRWWALIQAGAKLRAQRPETFVGR